MKTLQQEFTAGKQGTQVACFIPFAEWYVKHTCIYAERQFCVKGLYKIWLNLMSLDYPFKHSKQDTKILGWIGIFPFEDSIKTQNHL